MDAIQEGEIVVFKILYVLSIECRDGIMRKVCCLIVSELEIF